VTGQDIQYIDMSEAEVRDSIAASGAPPALATALAQTLAGIRANRFAYVADTVACLTGHPAPPTRRGASSTLTPSSKRVQLYRNERPGFPAKICPATQRRSPSTEQQAVLASQYRRAAAPARRRTA